VEKRISELLREKGYKVTPQRIAIYKALLNTKSHPSAEMIYNELQPHHPTMSLATVYKTVEILREMGLIQILNAGEDSCRYDADTSMHPHVRCMHCGRVDDLYVDSSEFIEEVALKTNYRLIGQQFYFYGICPDCQAIAAN
jgi:Fur family peroxide stress response transcriptional regulator